MEIICAMEDVARLSFLGGDGLELGGGCTSGKWYFKMKEWLVVQWCVR